jgi:hypothetical protein
MDAYRVRAEFLIKTPRHFLEEGAASNAPARSERRGIRRMPLDAVPNMKTKLSTSIQQATPSSRRCHVVLS